MIDTSTEENESKHKTAPAGFVRTCPLQKTKNIVTTVRLLQLFVLLWQSFVFIVTKGETRKEGAMKGVGRFGAKPTDKRYRTVHIFLFELKTDGFPCSK